MSFSHLFPRFQKTFDLSSKSFDEVVHLVTPEYLIQYVSAEHLPLSASVSYSQTAQDISVANVQTLFKSLSTRAGHTHVSELAKESVDDTAETRSQPEPSISRDETQQPEEKTVSAVDQKEAIEPDNKTHAEEKQNHISHQLGNKRVILSSQTVCLNKVAKRL